MELTMEDTLRNEDDVARIKKLIILMNAVHLSPEEQSRVKEAAGKFIEDFTAKAKAKQKELSESD